MTNGDEGTFAEDLQRSHQQPLNGMRAERSRRQLSSAGTMADTPAKGPRTLLSTGVCCSCITSCVVGQQHAWHGVHVRLGGYCDSQFVPTSGVLPAVVKRENDDDEDVEQTGTVEDAAAAAIAAQPTGFTLATTNVQTEVTGVSVRNALQLPVRSGKHSRLQSVAAFMPLIMRDVSTRTAPGPFHLEEYPP